MIRASQGGDSDDELMQENNAGANIWERACHDSCDLLNSTGGRGSYINGLMQRNEAGANKENGRVMTTVVH